VEAHAEDLRTECQDDELVAAIKRDYRTAGIDAKTRTMLEYVDRVTLVPYNLREDEVEQLRTVGFTDEDILDIVHITGYFNHINRLADALGVDLEDFMARK